MTKDLVRDLGYLCLGTRLKRLGERLQSSVQSSTGGELALQPGLFPILAALQREGPCTVTNLSETLGVSQPGVTRSLSKLASLGFARTTRGTRDQRQRVADLTVQGRRVIAEAEKELWPRVEAAVRELCEDLEGPFLQQIDSVEARLSDYRFMSE